MKCTYCKGSGRMTQEDTSTYHDRAGNWHKVILDTFETDCIACDGTGEEEGDQAEYDKSQEESRLNPIVYDDDF
jgi:hypothetical protein